MEPGKASAWVDPGVVAGFAASPPNLELIEYAGHQRGSSSALRVLDIGCGAGRNAVPLALSGADVIGTDLSLPMLQAAQAQHADGRLHLALAAMHALPVRDRSIDLIVAHGIWNLARSGAELRQAITEAARVAAKGAALFVFTFSRHTVQPDAAPVAGETFVFTQFSGAPQVFLTRDQLLGELRAAGFGPDPDLPLRELNLPPALSEGRAGAFRVEGPALSEDRAGAARVEGPRSQVRLGGAPVIYQAAFRFTGE